MATTIHFFASEADLPAQLAAGAFGPVSGQPNTKYRVSSLFTGSATTNRPMAHAVIGARVVFFVSDSDPTRYNVVLRPLAGLPGLPPIKYFIYRGILKSDYLDSAGALVTGDTCRLKAVIEMSNNPAQAMNSYASEAGTTPVDDLFLKQENQFATVNPGDSLGHFDTTTGFNYGFEIVLDEPGQQLTVADARKSDNVIDIAALTAADAREAARLHVLAYLDPAAFYGLCTHDKFAVKNNGGSTYAKGKVYGLVSKFATKNNVYVDVRDRWDLPYGFVGGTTGTFKISQGAGAASGATAIAYRGTDQWPLHLLQSAFAGPVSGGGYTSFKLKLSLALDGIARPLLQLQTGYWSKYFPQSRDDISFTKLTTSGAFTSDAVFTVIAGKEGTTTVPAATYLRVQLTDYVDATALQRQVPLDQPFDNKVFDLAGMFAPEALSPPQFAAITEPRIKTAVRMAPHITYGLHKGAAIAFRRGVAVDSDGVVAFCIRDRQYVPLESNKTAENEKIVSNTLATVLSLQSGDYAYDGFWAWLTCYSEYEYTYVAKIQDKKGRPVNTYVQGQINGEVVRPCKLNLPSENANLLEVRCVDPLVIRGYEYSPAEPFACLAYSTAERTAINTLMNDAAKFAAAGPKFLVYDAIPAVTTPAGSRGHYKSNLQVRGLRFVSGQFTWVNEPTNIAFYSVDGEHYFTNGYATAAFARIAGTVWDNGTVPDAVPAASNPLLNTGKYDSTLKNQLYAHLQALATTDPRLLHGELRDGLYADNLDEVTFQSAFRAPFLTERPREIPYKSVTINSVSKDNNPYIANFESWLVTANALRALQTTPALEPLARTGLTAALTNAIAADRDAPALYGVLDVDRNASFAAHAVPAFMARVMEDENARATYVRKPHFPLNHTQTPISYTAADLTALVTAGIIDGSIKAYLTGLGAATFGWKKLLQPDDARGYYIVKKSSSANFDRVYAIKGMPKGNGSGITIGMGFDMGRQDLATYLQYTADLTIPHAQDAREALGKQRGAAVALCLLFDEDIWNGFIIEYDFAVEKTVPFMETKYLTALVSQIHAGGAAAWLKVYPKTGNGQFWTTGAVQYFNEVEKALLLSHVYNAGAGSISTTRDLGKCLVHAVNTHDFRWLQLAWKHASVDANRKTKMQVLLDRPETAAHYDHTQTSL